MARRRILRPEERELWDKVARTAEPMHPGRKLPEPPPAPAAPEAAPRPLILPEPQPEPFRLPAALRLGSRARSPGTRIDLAPTPSEALAAAPVRMDAGTHKSMTRGKISPEARLDLHGLTLAEAHPELIRFLMNAQSDGKRLVLVITGKGKDRDDGGPIPSRIGALRHQLPHWLALPPLRHIVLQASQAHLKHGGAGAWYIYLRRLR